MNRKEVDRQESLDFLRKIVKPGDTIHCILRHVSRSGMSRDITPVLIDKDGSISYIGYHAARVLGLRCDDQAVKIGGCGMDMGFHLVYELSHALFKESGFKCLGEAARCPANDHSNDRYDGIKDGYNPERVHSDAGYALRYRWI